MSHKIIIERVRQMPEHYQRLFESWRIFMGMENAYYRVMDNIKADRVIMKGV